MKSIIKFISTIKGYLGQLKRIWPDVIACCAVTGALYTGVHEKLPPSLQLVFFKLVLVSMALVHAHIAGKLMFGRVEWQDDNFTPKKVLRISLYIVVVVAYSMGG